MMMIMIMIMMMMVLVVVVVVVVEILGVKVFVSSMIYLWSLDAPHVRKSYIYIYHQQSYPVHISANLMCPAKEQRSSAFAVPAVLLGHGSVEVRPTLANVNCWPMGDPCLVGNLYIEPHLVLENSVEIWYIRPMTVSSLQ